MKPSVAAILFRIRRAAMVDLRVSNALRARGGRLSRWHLQLAVDAQNTVAEIRRRFPEPDPS
ncbi:MAG: hypothetical protein ABIS50_15235 [Luteolibacter sp.]|uniref:hypothetical protein n=1 Tax=Luteolibacter sp. TaxID=1962973 RepID=UPI003264400F